MRSSILTTTGVPPPRPAARQHKQRDAQMLSSSEPEVFCPPLVLTPCSVHEEPRARRNSPFVLDTSAQRPGKGEMSSSSPLCLNEKGLSKSKNHGSWFPTLFFWVLNVPVLFCFAVYCSAVLVQKLKDDFWVRQFEMEIWNESRWENEYTYYARDCSDNRKHMCLDLPELLFQPNDTAEDARQKMLKNGAMLYPYVLQPDTAKELRDFILKQNLLGKDMIHVIQNENRYSFAVQVDQHPSVAKALKEILNQPRLVEVLEAVLGPDPAVIELTAITATYGAESQFMHADVIPSGNSARFARNFVPSYSLFIPLQNTTAKMGATHVCSGTHTCFEGASKFCEEFAPQLSETPARHWPVGWGALVNQQTMHKGAMHDDPNGPERVLFILTFAPRPLFSSKRSLETRILGTGGSYSLHWSNWGHTLRDFAQPERYMTAPWRHLRALGLYKPARRNWGWDFWTVTHQRIAQVELGYGNNYLLKAWDSGVLDWIPVSIRGTRSLYDEKKSSKRQKQSQYEQPAANEPNEEDEEEDEEEDDEEEDDDSDTPFLAWKDFAENVVANFVVWATALYVKSLVFFIGVLGFTNFAFYGFGGIRSVSFWRSSRYLVWGHIVVALAAWLYHRNLEQGTWARNIRQGLAFNTDLQDHSELPNLPSTFPTFQDVMVPTEYQSDYLASFTELLDYAHGGNMEWKKQVDMSFPNYSKMTESLQTALCQELVLRVGQAGGRFLSKNQRNQWGVLTPNMTLQFCDKVLKCKDDLALGHAVKWTDYLLSEIRFGYWRKKRPLKLFTVALLQTLQSRLLKQQPHNTSLRHWNSNKMSPKNQGLRLVWHLASKFPRFFKKEEIQRTVLPPRSHVKEPYFGAWLQVGDVVEGKYQGKFNEWYRGKIESLVVTDETWNVRYDDGELDLKLCKEECVRPFVPFSVGEIVGWRDENKTFKDSKILRYHRTDTTYDIQLFTGRVILGVNARELRRGVARLPVGSNNTVSWHLGQRVVTFWPEEDYYYPAEITMVLSNNRYQVEYDDGTVDFISGNNIVVPDSEEEMEQFKKWSVGDSVAARYPGEQGTFFGVVSNVLGDSGRYKITYEDGDVAIVSSEMILGPRDDF